MSTFNCALFLPYTVDFASTAVPARRPSFPSSPHPTATTRSSLLGQLSPPGSPTDGREPEVFTKLDPSSPALHFATPSNPRSLARTDSHVPEWGRGRVFNQPKQRKSSHAPPSTILKYTKERPIGLVDTRSDSSDRFSTGSWTIKPALQGNGGLTNAVRAATDQDSEDRLWVGTLGFPTDIVDRGKLDDIQDRLESDYQALTVLAGDHDFDGHYNHYCKTILWPVFHYVIPDHPKSKAFEDHSWKYYVKVNQDFADRVIRSYKHGDIVWIHDYHLLLVPKMIRDKLPDARIGFFLHAAFPSSEVFRCLAARKQLLEGMLGANLVVFQAPEYAGHFLQSCSRLLVVEVTASGVQLDDHFVDVTHVPIGIVPDQLKEARQDPEVQSWIKIITEKYAGKFLIVARDKLDNIRGVKQKLTAYEMFLEKYPQYSQKVVLIQVATSTPNDQKDLVNTISDIVTRVNSKHSTLAHQPLVFLRQDIAFPQYLAMLTSADALLTTSLRDGMNLTCHEFILCQDGDGGPKKHGPLILSEFTGSSALFNGADLSVNPWDSLQLVKAIKHAVEMTDEERDLRYAVLHQIVLRHNGVDWIGELSRRLEGAYENHQLRDVMSVPRLSINNLVEQYRLSVNRLFLLDYEGTLISDTTATQRTIDTLVDLLANSDRNVVYVTSNRTPAELERVFNRVPGLGLIAENGCLIRPFNSDEWIDLASNFVQPGWKEGTLRILNYYKDRIEGSSIEERNCGLIFHYEKVPAADIESAERQAGECVNHINDSCETQRIRAVPGDKKVFIEPANISKATAAKWIIRNAQQPKFDLSELMSDTASIAGSVASEDEAVSRRPRRSTVSTIASRRSLSRKRRDQDKRDVALPSPFASPSIMAQDEILPPPQVADLKISEPTPDFLMVAGDDREDEALYRWANKISRQYSSGAAGGIKYVSTVCVGKKNTEAGATLTQGSNGLLTALGKLSHLRP